MDYKKRADELFREYYEYALAESEKYEAEMARQKEIERQKIMLVIESANKGDVDAILKLKEFAKDGDIDAQNALKNLYWDGNKAHAVGIIILRDGIT